MIHLDQPALIEARRTRLDAACELLSVDGWLLTTSQAVRTATGPGPMTSISSVSGSLRSWPSVRPWFHRLPRRTTPG